MGQQDMMLRTAMRIHTVHWRSCIIGAMVCFLAWTSAVRSGQRSVGEQKVGMLKRQDSDGLATEKLPAGNSYESPVVAGVTDHSLHTPACYILLG